MAETVAVDSLDFEVAPGTVTGFLGPNGAGKTTTMRAILGLIRPDPGEGRVLGGSYHLLNRPIRRVGALIEGEGFHPARTARAHLRNLTSMAGMPIGVGQVRLGVLVRATPRQQRGWARWATQGRLRIRPCSRGRPHPARLCEVLEDEKAATATAFTHRAIEWFATHGIDVQAVMTDNGSCYRSYLYTDTLTAASVQHVRIPPRQPQINGKVERFNRTLLDEWAYVRVYTSEQHRIDALAHWKHAYNHHRNHTAIGGPLINRATNVAAQHI